MERQQPDRQNKPPQPIQLDYRRPAIPLDCHAADRDPPAGNVPYIAQMAIGFGAFLLTGGLILGLFSILVNFRAPFGVFYVLPIVVPLAGLVSVSATAWHRWNWRGFVAGVLLGLGILALAVGLCFAVVLAAELR